MNSQTKTTLCVLLALLAPLLPTVLPGAAALAATPPVERMVLPNNLVVLISEEHSLPFLTFQLLVDSGSWRDPPELEGLANLTAKSILLGTSTRPVTAINRELDFMGSSLHSTCGRDYATLSLQTLTKHLDEGFAILLETITQPVFPEVEIRREVDKIIGSIRADEDDPGEVAEKAFRRILFTTSPYAHPVEGSVESMQRMTRQKVAEFYKAHYQPNNSILVIVGDITVDEVKAKLLPRLLEWPEATVPEAPFETAFAEGPLVRKIARPITQANIILGHGGVARGNEDYYAISVMNYILGGGGLGSRLVDEIRIKRGLAYSVTSVFVPHRNPGSFQIILQTRNESAEEAVNLALEQMERIRKEPVSVEELDTAKRYLIGSFPLKLDTQRGLANFFSQVEYYGLGLDYPEKYPSLIRSVSQDDVLRVAGAYLHPRHYILVVVAQVDEAVSGER